MAPMTGKWAVECRGLTKRFGGLAAVDGLDLGVRQGEIYALLGRNGAGKTTTIGMLTTLVGPTSGDAWVAGYSVRREAAQVRRHVGVVLQESALDRYLSVEENLLYLARAYHLPGPSVRRRVEAVLMQLGLIDARGTVVAHLSGGNRRRAEIAAGMLHRPAVILLDEPTVGLDVETRRYIWNHVREVASEGTAVILTTHYLEEADALADRIGILERGRLVAEGRPSELKAALGGRELSVKTNLSLPSGLHNELSRFGQVEELDRGFRLRLAPEADMHEVLAVLSSTRDLDLREMRLGATTLDEAFLRAVAKAGNEDRSL